jgi:hypothetical protein
MPPPLADMGGDELRAKTPTALITATPITRAARTSRHVGSCATPAPAGNRTTMRASPCSGSATRFGIDEPQAARAEPSVNWKGRQHDRLCPTMRRYSRSSRQTSTRTIARAMRTHRRNCDAGKEAAARFSLRPRQRSLNSNMPSGFAPLGCDYPLPLHHQA